MGTPDGERGTLGAEDSSNKAGRKETEREEDISFLLGRRNKQVQADEFRLGGFMAP